MSWLKRGDDNSLPGAYYTWQLERPEPALPSSYFWTWDHSTNWVLDDPGIQNEGCYNIYYKHPETFVEDYRRLTDMAAGIGVKGVSIYGFLRDSHGGAENAKRVASYAASQGVAIMPGFGTTWYGGAYYEGDSPYSLEVFLDKNPEAIARTEDGEPFNFAGVQYVACPFHPAYQEWLAESLEWLFKEFEIGGLNAENGDMVVDYHPLTRAARKDWPADDPEEFFFQGASYRQVLENLSDRLKTSLITYATYTGFGYTEGLVQDQGMGNKPPAMFSILPADGICQWTLTGMLLDKPLPLTAYLDDGAPAAAFDNPKWPADLRPPSTRSVGFVHQGSQWRNASRYDCTVSSIKEACLRAYRGGLEGVSIHGEVSNRYIPYALNYLAFSHFIHWPEDTLRDFGRKTLAQVLGSEEMGEAYALVLAHWDAGTLTEDLKKLSDPANHGYDPRFGGSRLSSVESYQRFLFWDWLHGAVNRDTYRRINSAFPF